MIEDEDEQDPPARADHSDPGHNITVNNFALFLTEICGRHLGRHLGEDLMTGMTNSLLYAVINNRRTRHCNNQATLTTRQSTRQLVHERSSTCCPRVW